MSSVHAMPAAPSPRPAARRIDVTAERRATAGAGLANHLNAAGSALPTSNVVSAVVEHLRAEESRGGYEAAAEQRDALDRGYSSAAELIGAQADEIAFFDSASTGLRTVVDALRPGTGHRIIASSSTYVSHALHLMSVAEERGVELIIAPTRPDRTTDLATLEEILADGTPSIVSVAHIPTSSGLVEPAAEIGALVRRHGGTYILDATQSVGHLRVDVDEIACDVLVTTGRKFLRAPRGTGFAYVRRELLENMQPVAPDVRGAVWSAARTWELEPSARRFETWEGSIAGRLGLGAAIEEALARDAGVTEEWLCDIGDRLRDGLACVDGVRIADPASTRSAIVTFTVEGAPSTEVVAGLARRGVRVVSVPATHGQWDLGDRGLVSVVRASPHVYNDDNDLAALVDGVASIRGAL